MGTTLTRGAWRGQTRHPLPRELGGGSWRQGVHPLFQPPVRLREGDEVPQAEEATHEHLLGLYLRLRWRVGHSEAKKLAQRGTKKCFVYGRGIGREGTRVNHPWRGGRGNRPNRSGRAMNMDTHRDKYDDANNPTTNIKSPTDENGWRCS